MGMILLLLLLSHGPFPQAGDARLPIRGKYVNPNYGYSAVIPRGIPPFTSRPPLPNHGFGAHLSQKPESYLWANGSYNALGWGSLEEEVAFHTDSLKGEHGAVEAVGREQTRLSTLKALRVVVRYTSGGTKMVDDVTLAFRPS